MASPRDAATAQPHESFVLVANYDSDVGYAWWLMESFWVALATRWSDRYRMVLAYPSISTVPASIAAAPIAPLRMSFTRHGWADLRQQLVFIREHRVRVLYCTDQRVWGWRYLAFRLAGVRRVVVHDHTPGNRVRPTGLKALGKWVAARLPWFSVDALIAVSSFVRQRHLEVNLFPPHRCFVAENGLPARPMAAPVDVHAQFEIPAARRVVVTVGRADRVKGVELVIEAMAELVVANGRTDVHLLHCGDGPDLERFTERAARLGITDYVTFAGRQSDIPGILRGCDIAIHASSAEVGYSLAVLECMEAALPVVVSDDPSVSGATESEVTGLTFATGHAGAAAAALARLLDNPVRSRQMGQAGRVQLLERYALSRTHQQLLQAMDTVLGPSTS